MCKEWLLYYVFGMTGQPVNVYHIYFDVQHPNVLEKQAISHRPFEDEGSMFLQKFLVLITP